MRGFLNQINTEGLSVPVSKSLIKLLATPLEQSLTKPKIKNDVIIDGIVGTNSTNATVNTNAITFNFRSPDYSAEQGGYYPVEIHFERQ